MTISARSSIEKTELSKNRIIITNPNPAHSHSSIIPFPQKAVDPRKKKLGLIAVAVLFLWLAGVMIYQTHKPLPAGISMEGPVHRIAGADIDFLYDLTYKGSDGAVQEQMIFDRMYNAIDEAERFIVVDMFLWNGYYDEQKVFPPLSRSFADKLIAKKAAHPEMPMIVITDEINTLYGSHASPELERLKAHGIQTVITGVDRLRDSTPIYSAVWRTFLQWFGQSGKGWMTNPFADNAPKLTMRSYLKIFNVKANHRKVMITDKSLIVTSANAHDASALNSNSGFEVKGNVIGDALASEQAAVRLSDGLELPTFTPQKQEEGDVEVRLLTEGAILRHALKALRESGAGDTVWMGMFYLAERQVIEELLAASSRGAEIRLILDPNENAFGNDKVGIPNRPVAAELLEKSDNRIRVRWYNTDEEQYHTKLMMIDGKEKVAIHNGSANFTKRNLDDLNLETNLGISAPPRSKIAKHVRQYFERIWYNDGAEFTIDYPVYKDSIVRLKRGLYMLQNWIGFTTY